MSSVTVVTRRSQLGISARALATNQEDVRTEARE